MNRNWELYEKRMRPIRRARLQAMTQEEAFALYESMWQLVASVPVTGDEKARLLRKRREEKLETRERLFATRRGV